MQFITFFKFLLLSAVGALEEKVPPVITVTNYLNTIFIHNRVKIKMILAKLLLLFYLMSFPILEHSVENPWDFVPRGAIFLLYRARLLFESK